MTVLSCRDAKDRYAKRKNEIPCLNRDDSIVMLQNVLLDLFFLL